MEDACSSASTLSLRLQPKRPLNPPPLLRLRHQLLLVVLRLTSSRQPPRRMWPNPPPPPPLLLPKPAFWSDKGGFLSGSFSSQTRFPAKRQSIFSTRRFRLFLLLPCRTWFLGGFFLLLRKRSRRRCTIRPDPGSEERAAPTVLARSPARTRWRRQNQGARRSSPPLTWRERRGRGSTEPSAFGPPSRAGTGKGLRQQRWPGRRRGRLHPEADL